MSESPRLRVVFDATVEKGQLVMREPARWRGWLGRHEGKRVSVIVDRFRKPRSLPANAYLWGVVYRTAAEWSGHDEEELHEVFKAMFLPAPELILPTGETVEGRRSTASLDMEQFSDYVSKVKRWLAEQGVYVPEPSEYEQSQEVWS